MQGRSPPLVFTELGEPELASELRQPHEPWKHPQKLWDFGCLCLGHCSFLIRSPISHEFNSKQCYQQIQMTYILSHLLLLSHTVLGSKRCICKALCDEKWLIPPRPPPGVGAHACCVRGRSWEQRQGSGTSVTASLELGLSRVRVSSQRTEHLLVPNTFSHPERNKDKERGWPPTYNDENCYESLNMCQRHGLAYPGRTGVGEWGKRPLTPKQKPVCSSEHPGALMSPPGLQRPEARWASHPLCVCLWVHSFRGHLESHPET